MQYKSEHAAADRAASHPIFMLMPLSHCLKRPCGTRGCKEVVAGKPGSHPTLRPVPLSHCCDCPLAGDIVQTCSCGQGSRHPSSDGCCSAIAANTHAKVIVPRMPLPTSQAAPLLSSLPRSYCCGCPCRCHDPHVCYCMQGKLQTVRPLWQMANQGMQGSSRGRAAGNAASGALRLYVVDVFTVPCRNFGPEEAAKGKAAAKAELRARMNLSSAGD